MNIKLLLAVGAGLAIGFGGIVGFLIYVSAIGCLWLCLLQRGLLFIQAYLFLKTLWQTGSVDLANSHACDLGIFESGKYFVEAVHMANHKFSGQQLLLIGGARSLGFRK